MLIVEWDGLRVAVCAFCLGFNHLAMANALTVTRSQPTDPDAADVFVHVGVLPRRAGHQGPWPLAS